MPQRIRLQRTAGFKKPGDAIVVSRPSKWGNPFKVGEKIDHRDELFCYVERTLPDFSFETANVAVRYSSLTILTPQVAVDAFTWWLIEQPHLMLSLGELKGHDLACWCPLDQPCHADALIELANA